ncbi:hypothetical protein QQ054_36530 [Oscillatoria amoena NRMC-F 0135]|nr:hypothetical protein [Oscillatoria amoena NRMC-F 0135]
MLRTACKESHPKDNSKTILIPIGSGWGEIAVFLAEHIKDLSNIKFSVVNLIDDWEYKVLFNKDSIQADEALAIKTLTLFFIDKIESDDNSWVKDFPKEKYDTLITTLFNLADLSKPEITLLFERVLDNKDNYWFHDKSFYGKIIKKSSFWSKHS